MVFKCQEDSFLKEYETKVVSCVKRESAETSEGGDGTIGEYEVVLEDTILFPEGGGQPCDFGFLNDKKVYRVTRRKAEAVHFLNEPFAVGEMVKQRLDWDRRLDHMQQHSGQHLITAILDRDYGFNTSSWWLGEQVSYVELDTPTVTPEQIENVEKIVNELIRASTKVNVSILSGDELNSSKVRARGLPKDHVGDVRLVTIEGVETNMCCGTHVSCLSQLQTIKLLHTEKGKRKNTTLLHFLVGNRVLTQLAACLDREKSLTVLLKNNPVQHAELVEKLQKNVKTTTKHLQTVLKELAIYEAEKLKSANPKPKYFSLHRKEADSNFLNTFIKEYGDTDVLLFLSVGDDDGAGNIMLHGQPAHVETLGPQFCELLNGKGIAKGNKFQAKVQNLSNRKKCLDVIEKYFS